MENQSWSTKNDKNLINAIKNKKWVKIEYQESLITIKPIIYGVSSYGDYFVYAWGWHSGKPGYYRFDVDKIKNVGSGQDIEDPIEQQYKVHYPIPTWVEDLIEFRDDYPGWQVPIS